MWKYHRCYGYIINRSCHTKKRLKWNGLVFHWCLLLYPVLIHTVTILHHISNPVFPNFTCVIWITFHSLKKGVTQLEDCRTLNCITKKRNKQCIPLKRILLLSFIAFSLELPLISWYQKQIKSNFLIKLRTVSSKVVKCRTKITKEETILKE